MKCDVFVCGEISVCPLVRSLLIRATRRFLAIERDDELRRDVAHGPAPRPSRGPRVYLPWSRPGRAGARGCVVRRARPCNQDQPAREHQSA